MQQETLAERAGASWGDVGSVADRQSGWEWNRSQPCQGATELGFPGPTLGQMQSEAAGRAGKPSGQGEEPSPERLGGYDLRTQTEPPMWSTLPPPFTYTQLRTDSSFYSGR